MTTSFRRIPRVGVVGAAVAAAWLTAHTACAQGNFNFTASTPVMIFDVNAAQPYPSTLNVSGVPGVISRASVTLLGLTHTFPDDLDVLLVGPLGQKIMLMSDAGGGSDVSGINLRFDDNAPVFVPDNGPLTGVTNRPADYEPGETLPAPAPPGPYATTLTTLVGTSAVGNWSLYVVDDRGDDVGQILSGWRLDVTTVNPATVTDLGLGMFDTPDPVSAGGSLSWTMSITNFGPLAATNLRLTNFLPANVTFQTATSPQGACAHLAGVVNCNFSSLAVGAVAQASITATPLVAGVISNFARISATQADLAQGNNGASAITTVAPGTVADLRLGLTDRPDPVVAGSNIIYAISITNYGPLTAAGTVVSNLLPASVEFVAVSTSTGACVAAGQTVICQLGDLPFGAQALVSVVARPTVAGSFTNTARVSSSVPDLTTAQASVVTRVNEEADLAVALIEPFDPVAIGNPVTYTILVTNLGVNTARQVSMVETLPVGIIFRSAIPSQGTCQNFSGVLLCDLGTLSNGAWATILVDVQPISLQPMVTGVSVSSYAFDPNPANNQLSEHTTTFPVTTGNPLGTGIQIIPTNTPSVLVGAVTSSGLNGLRVTSTRLQSWATTNLSTTGIYFVGSTNSTFGLARGGVVMSTGNVRDYETGPNRFLARSTAFGRPANAEQDALLNPITGFGIVDLDHFDATLFELRFDMLPGYDLVDFQVVFGSEEWDPIQQMAFFPFLDGFGIYLNGTNIAFSGGLPINVFHPDMGDSFGTELNGTVAPGGNPVLTFSAPVVAGSSNNVIQFIIADATDAAIDTTIFVSSFEGAQSPNADLTLSISDAPKPVTLGSNLTYTISVQNLGPYRATNVIVATLIPPQVTMVSVQGSQGQACQIFGDLINCPLGNLDRSATAAVTLVVQANGAGLPGLITNAALVVCDLADFSALNNYAEIVSTVVPFGTFGVLGPLPILDAAPNLPYPSILQVSGLPGVVTRVAVRLEGLSHTYPADLDFLLVDPSGRRVMLMSDAGWDIPVDAVNLQFDVDGFDNLPQFGPISSGTYSPTDFEPGDPFFGFPPGFTYATSLSELTGRSPNGPWSLYIMDDRGVDTGVLTEGWRLILETGPTPESPTLAVRRVGNTLEFSWPDSASGFFLESTPGLSPGAIWTQVPEPPVVGGGLVRVTVPLAVAGNAFYRLRL